MFSATMISSAFHFHPSFYFRMYSNTIYPHHQASLSSKTKNIMAKKKFNWENLNLFGPLIEPINNSFRRREKSKKTMKFRLINRDTKKNREPVQDILGDKKRSVKVMKSMLNQTTNEDRILSVLRSHKNVVEKETFPFEMNENDEELKRRADEIIKMSLHHHNLPSVSGILEKTRILSEIEETKKSNLSEIMKIGLTNFYEYLRELNEIELTLRDCMKSYFVADSKKRKLMISENVFPYWNSMEPFLTSISNVTLNRNVFHCYLNYTGIVDCLAKWQNRNVLVEILLPYPRSPLVGNVEDAPLRAAAYVAALNSHQDKEKIDDIILLIPNKNESFATVEVMDSKLCLIAWNLWMQRFQEYWRLRHEKPMINYNNLSPK